MVEIREFTLTDNGPANVVEITEPKGILESGYRGFYADKPDNDTREGFAATSRSEYLCDDLSKVERTDPADLSQPFKLTIACEKAKRGYTELESAQAAIRRRPALPVSARGTQAERRFRREEDQRSR